MPAPTFPASADLVEGTGTRSFTAVTTAANDWLVVELIVELGVSGVPALSPLTWTQQNDRDDGANRTEVFQYTAQDTVGGSRTIQIVPGTTANYRARLTVVRGSGGPGTGKGVAAAQTVSVTRQGANSAMFMTVGDWSAGAIGTPVWTPGGATTASQRNASTATYIFGRWNDSGSVATASHGISSPSYGTPSIAVLEMRGTAGGSTVNGTALAALSFTAAASGTRTVRATTAAVLAFTATAAGLRTVSGAAASTFAFTATATGTVSTPAGEVSGVAAAALAFTAAAAGARTVVGQAATPLSFSTAASGGRTVLGVADTSLGFAASAFGQVAGGPATVAGAATATLTFAASAQGIRVALGQASGAFGFAAAALGAPSRQGLAASAFAFRGVAAGVVSTPQSVVVRPSAGVVARPSAGVVARPLTGVVARPGSGAVVRPDAGVVSRP